MTLVDRYAYRQVSGDLDSFDFEVDNALVTAQQLLEEFLDRGLEAIQRTEVVRIHPDGRAYVRSMPLQSVSSPANTVIRDQAIYGLYPQPNPIYDITFESYRDPLGGIVGGWGDTTLPTASVTYIGGYTVSTLPRKLLQALVDLTRIELTAFSPVTAAVSRASVGDVSVVYAEPADRSGALDAVLSQVRGWRRRELGH